MLQDISGVPLSLQTARAIGLLACNAETVTYLQQPAQTALLEIARTAGVLAAKQAAHLLPHTHPATLDKLQLTFTFLAPGTTVEDCENQPTPYGLAIMGEGTTVGRAGIGAAVLTAVGLTALTLYDQLYPRYGSQLAISSIKLVEQVGGPEGWRKYSRLSHSIAMLVCSSDVATGKRPDKAGPIVRELLQSYGHEIVDYQIVPEEAEAIQQQIRAWVAQDVAFVFTVGSTGLNARDCAVAAVEAILEREADGIVAAMRQYGQMRTPLAMLSRMAAGAMGNTLVVTLPGSTNGARESLESILPAVFHARQMLKK